MNRLSTRKLVACHCATLSLLLLSACAVAAASCNKSPLKISASIEYISPDTATLTVRHAGRADRQARIGDCLVAGDTVIVPTTVKLAKVFTSERLVRLQPDQPPYLIGGGMGHIANQAATYLASVVHALSSEPLPDLPSATASRSFGDPPALRALAELNTSTTQRIPESVEEIIVAWRPIAATPRCTLRTAGGSVAASPMAEESWCTLRVPVGMANAVVLAETASPSAPIRWQVVAATDADLPRPPWLKPDSNQGITNSDRAVWGLWLYREAAPQWRLAGLSMLIANRTSSWAAARATWTILSAGSDPAH
jgi:hypothetical protein